MKEIKRQTLTGERALFAARDLSIAECTFEAGESPLKESRNIILSECAFKWKYPLWYSENVKVDNCTLFDTARAGIWYTRNIEIKNTTVEAPKTFRRSSAIKLENVYMPNAQETLWNCSYVTAKNIHAHGSYFAMNCSSMRFDGLELVGDYSFDGAKDVEIRNSRLLSKDAFWNSENITVYNSYIAGEYLGWNAKNLTLVDCTIESLQGLCYIENLVMKNCKLINTTLAFEYSSVDADITGKIDSVLNPKSGKIIADAIDVLTVEKDRVDPSKTKITCRAVKQ